MTRDFRTFVLGQVGEGALQLDDMRGEELAPALEAIRAAGALDAWWTAVGMKKTRPGVLLSFLAREEARGALAAFLGMAALMAIIVCMGGC